MAPPWLIPDGAKLTVKRADRARVDAARGAADTPAIDMTTRRITAIVTGRVQGVSYRASTIHEAQRLGITGWVRNRSDGSVELEAQGTPAQIDALLAWCQVGPPAARVTDVAVRALAVNADERGFRFDVE